LGNTRTVLFESENKEGYIHGFENYVKVKHRGIQLVNTLHEINLTTIDTDGSVRMECS
jgi:threonylcarbamoyladenosine tRNA methylthiotransferase MtaB